MTSNPQIHFLRFQWGMGGDFIINEISKDPNYYDCYQVYNRQNNTVTFDDSQPLATWGIEPKSSMGATLTEQQHQEIDQAFNEKNLILGTHAAWENINNWPRIQRHRLVANERDLMFFWALVWLKRIHNPVYYKVLALIPESNSGWTNLHLVAHTYNTKDLNQLALKFWADYWSHGNITTKFDPQWLQQHQPLDVGKFFFNPTAELLEVWRQEFDCEQPISLTAVQAHHERNLALFEQELGMAYTSDLSNRSIMTAVINWIQTKHPEIVL